MCAVSLDVIMDAQRHPPPEVASIIRKTTEVRTAQDAAHIARRKAIYEALHPETRAESFHGNRHTGSRRQSGEGQIRRFTAETAKGTGRSERSVQRSAERGKKLGTDLLDRIAGSWLDKGAELDALAALLAEQREDLVARADAGDPLRRCQDA